MKGMKKFFTNTNEMFLNSVFYNTELPVFKKDSKFTKLFVPILAIKFQNPATKTFNDIINFHNELMFIFIFILVVILLSYI